MPVFRARRGPRPDAHNFVVWWLLCLSRSDGGDNGKQHGCYVEFWCPNHLPHVISLSPAYNVWPLARCSVGVYLRGGTLSRGVRYFMPLYCSSVTGSSQFTATPFKLS